MINNDRIVPITAIDLISIYGIILIAAGIGGGTLPKLDAATTNGEFKQTRSGTVICSEPVKSFDFDISGGPAEGYVYFIPAYDYSGFTIKGVDATMEGDTVNADGRTLYQARLSNGTITIKNYGI
jgi:hypothetical protein